jgi:hypothetical protein
MTLEIRCAGVLSSYLIYGGDEALPSRIMQCFGEIVHEWFRGNDTGHYTL